MSIKRVAIWGGVTAVLITGFYQGLKPQPVLVETAEVVRDNLRVTIEEEGKTRVKDRYLVSAPVAGFVRRVELDVGDTISPGDRLTQLEPLRSDVLDPRRRAEAEARIAAARSALLSAEEQALAAKADSDYANAEYQRKQRLQKTNAISEEALSQALTARQRAKAVLRSARFAVEVARYELDAASTLLKYSAAQSSEGILKERVSITAPISGSVLKVFRESEGVVSAGTPLVELGDPAALEVAVDVLSFDAVRIKEGMPVELKRWGGKLLHAVVRLVEPVGFTEVSALGVEEQRVWVILDIISPASEWQSLGDGYRVEASFLLWHQDNVMQVPSASLFREGDGWALYVVENDSAQLRAVELGQRNGLMAQIVTGVQAGERVIVHPDDTVNAGDTVTVRR